MWIKKISISSFGSVKGFCEELSGEMTVVYGLNEAGKSTVAEFIRTTLFPNRSKRSRYPAGDKSDCGYIEMQMDGGDARTLERKYKKIREKHGKKTFYEEMGGFDLQTYSSIYGLDLKELADNESNSAEKLKDKILGTLGGENVPKICKQIDDKLDSLMNREKLVGNKPIESCLEERRRTLQDIKEVEEELSGYDKCVEEEKDLEDNIQKLRAKLESRLKEKESLSIIESNRENIDRYKHLVREYERDVAFSEDLSLGDCKTYDRLSLEVDSISKEVNSCGNISVLKEAEKIDRFWKDRDRYFEHMEEIRKIESDVIHDERDVEEIEKDTGWSVDDVPSIDDLNRIDLKTKCEVNRRNTICRFLPYFGNHIMFSVAIFMGILLIMQVNEVVEVPILIFGTVYILSGISLKFWNASMNKKWINYVESKGFYENTTPELVSRLLEKLRDLARVADRFDSRKESLSQYRDYVLEYESSIGSLLSRLGMSDKRISDRFGEAIEKIHDTLMKVRNLNRELSSARSRMDDLFKKYGGKDRFERKYNVKNGLDIKRREIENVKKNIESATKVSVDEVDKKLFLIDSQEKEETGLSDEIDDCNKRVGELKNKIYSMEERSGKIGDLNVKCNSIKADLKDNLYEWAVNSLAKNMIDCAKSRFYDRIKQIIHEDACRYLSLMTRGRYKLASNLADKELLVEDNLGSKNASKWSSGLSDQIYLSIKMAIAQRISSEKIPMIMDDVLVKFDLYRKKAACDAIYEFSKKNQVILFTCDCFVRDYFKNGKGHVIELPA